jgi:hypothetical protein
MQEERTERRRNSDEGALQPRQKRVGFATFEEGNGEGPVELEEYNTEEAGNWRSHERINGSVNEDDEEEIGEYIEEHKDVDKRKPTHSQEEEEEEYEEDLRWILVADINEQEEQQGPTEGDTMMSKGTGFIAALRRHAEIQDPELQAMGMAVRRGTRERRPRQPFDEDGKVDSTNVRTPEKRRQPRQSAPADKQRDVGVNRRYGTIKNVRTLAMKDDKNSKEADGRVAAALEWACEFEARGLGVIGLQECRVPGQVDGQEGECYRTFYSGNRDGESRHGVGLFLHEKVTRGEFDIQQVNERLMWAYGSIYGVQQAVFSVYAPTNRSDNEHEVTEFYSVMEREVRTVRTKYGADTPIVILGDFNARVGNGGAEN